MIIPGRSENFFSSKIISGNTCITVFANPPLVFSRPYKYYYFIYFIIFSLFVYLLNLILFITSGKDSILYQLSGIKGSKLFFAAYSFKNILKRDPNQIIKIK